MKLVRIENEDTDREAGSERTVETTELLGVTPLHGIDPMDPAGEARTRISDFLIGVELAEGRNARRIVECLLGIGDDARTANELAFELGMRRRDVLAVFRRALARARQEDAADGLSDAA